MKDILTYLAVLLILGILRVVLTRIKAVKSLLITKTVEAMEKKIQGSNRGAEKKARAIKRLKWLGVQADETTSAMIDIAVEVMNARNTTVKSSLKTEISEQLKTATEAAGETIKNKLSRDSGEEK